MSLAVDIRAQRGTFTLDVAFECPAGGRVAILGRNGSGKTSLVHAIAGLLPIESGSIRFGEETWLDSENRIFVAPPGRSIGVLFQELRLFPHLTVLDNIMFGLRARGIAPREAKAEAEKWLQEVGLSDRAKLLPTTLSGGEAQRVALVRAMATRPQILLLDEPLASIDQELRAPTLLLIRNLVREYEGTVLLVTHDPDLASSFVDRYILLENGRIRGQGPVSDLEA